jgi:hypothetical protein
MKSNRGSLENVAKVFVLFLCGVQVVLKSGVLSYTAVHKGRIHTKRAAATKCMNQIDNRQWEFILFYKLIVPVRYFPMPSDQGIPPTWKTQSKARFASFKQWCDSAGGHNEARKGGIGQQPLIVGFDIELGSLVYTIPPACCLITARLRGAALRVRPFLALIKSSPLLA